MDREKAPHGHVAWVDVQSPDIKKSRPWYADLFGWKYTGGDDPQMGFYTNAQLRGRNVAGLGQMTEGSPFPAVWSVYFATDDIAATSAKVKELGGTVVVPPMEIPKQGHMAIFQDPTGAFFGAWQSLAHKGAQVIGETGALLWNDLSTGNVDTALEFYTQLFGLTAEKVDMPEGEYYTLHKEGQMIGGLGGMPPGIPEDHPPFWNTYLGVDDVDAAVAKIEGSGGSKHSPPFDTPWGRMCPVKDPWNASFYVMKPAPDQG
jgi:uncharacterized protein